MSDSIMFFTLTYITSYLLNICKKCLYSSYNIKTIFFITLNLKQLSFLLYILFINISVQTKMFSDLLVSDYPNYYLRFLSIYNIISLIYNYRIILTFWVSIDNIIPSITNLYTCASWFEREVWDLFGIFYLNNLDLRRILNDYGFSGHPLKKDFPLSGFYELEFSYITGLVHSIYIRMVQEFRFFIINSPWKYYI